MASERRPSWLDLDPDSIREKPLRVIDWPPKPLHVPGVIMECSARCLVCGHEWKAKYEMGKRREVCCPECGAHDEPM